MKYALPKLAIDSVANVLAKRGSVDGNSLAARFETKRSQAPVEAPARLLSKAEFSALSMREREFMRNSAVEDDVFSVVDDIPHTLPTSPKSPSLTDFIM